MVFKKISAAILSAVFLTGCTVTYDGNYVPYSDSNTSDTASRDELYNGILDSLVNMKNVSRYDHDVDMSEVNKALHAIEHDYPEFFWISGYTVQSTGHSSDVTIDMISGIEQDNLKKMYTELTDAADRFIKDMPAGLTYYEKILYVHDNLILNTVYDKNGAASDANGLWGTAYGCLVQKSAVCQGYSEAFLYLMNCLGIECGIVTGETAEGSHAWNYVVLNGKYYWIDVTWDDPDESGIAGTPLLHSYCLIDDEHLLRSRTIDRDNDFVPQCYSMSDNFYVRRDAYITVYSEAAIGTVLMKSANTGEAEIMFADAKAYNDAMTQLFDNNCLWNLSEYAEFGDVVNYTNDDRMYVLKICY